MTDAARDARIWLVHVQEMSDSELPSMVEAADYHIRCLLAENEALREAVRGWMPRMRVIGDHAPKPLSGRAYDIFEEMEDLLDA